MSIYILIACKKKVSIEENPVMITLQFQRTESAEEFPARE